MVLGKSEGRRVVCVIKKTSVEMDVMIWDEYLIPLIVS